MPSVLAIVPLAGLLSDASEAVAARTGDTVGGVTVLVGGAAGMATAFSAARKNRLDLSVGARSLCA